MTRLIILLVLICLVFSCKSNNSAEPEIDSEEIGLPVIETGKPKTDSRNKATVYDEPLWDEKQLEKQLLYCVDRYIDLEEIDPYRFCACFINKARYTHEIDFLDQAFDDQEGWIIDCMESSPKQDF